MKRLKESLRHHWHDVYYALVSDSGVEFAMHCQDITAQMDLGPRSRSWSERLRFLLHLSLCQACSNYLRASRALKRAVCSALSAKSVQDSLTQLNHELLQKFSKD
jgi:hypothetical protein